MRVLKRDGREVAFDKEKIKHAVLSAFKEVDEGEVTDYAKTKAREIASFVESIDKPKISIEEIQDIVVEKLMNSNRKDVAASYVIFRNDRTRERDKNSQFRKEVTQKLMAKDVQNQNANVDEKSFGGRIGEASDMLLKKIALEEYISPMARENHINNRIYIHDLNSYVVGSHNCLTIPFDDLLSKGFNTRQTDVRPANSINTAFQLVAVIFQLQSLMQFGGVSASHLDWTMIPYVRKSFYKHFKDGLKYIGGLDDDYIEQLDERYKGNEPSIEDAQYKVDMKIYNYAMNMTEKETQQAVEGMFHNLNTLQSRSGNQLKMWLA